MASLPDIDSGGWKEGHEEDMTEIPNCFCPNCGGSNGTTVMLPTKVPLFREIIIMSLVCEDCNFRNSEVNFGGEIQERGIKLTLSVTAPSDLNRQLIKSDSATLTIPSLQFEIPPNTQRGSMSTVEGVLRRAADNLEALQGERLRLGDVDNFHRCREVIEKLRVFAGDDPDDEEDEEDGGKEAKDSHSCSNGDDENATRSFRPFDIILDDPAGNCFIENPYAPDTDPELQSVTYFRTPTQDMALGLQPSKEAVEAGTIDDADPAHKNVVNAPGGVHTVEIDANVMKRHGLLPAVKEDGDGGNDDEQPDDGVAAAAADSSIVSGGNTALGRQEVLKFPTPCPHCHAPAETDMCMTDIPHFKEVIIMSLVCEQCGYKSNEIKGGGAIPKFGTKIRLRIKDANDLAREVLKSDTAGISIPELELELDEGGLDGLYTTVEGLLNKMHDRLSNSNPFGSGDAATKQHLTNDGDKFSDPSPNHVRYMEFLTKLKSMADGTLLPFTLLLSDPLSNSFVGPIPKDAMALSLQAEKDGNHDCYDSYVDDGMDVEEYERTNDQNEILGLNDIKTENYQQEEDGRAAAAAAHNGQENGGANTTAISPTDKVYYGTDEMEDLPDRLRRLDHRGPDHPHHVAKAPVEGDTTVMGEGSSNFAVPAMTQRGKIKQPQAAETIPEEAETSNEDGDEKSDDLVQKRIVQWEGDDNNFVRSDRYDGPREGMVFKSGARGLGYYTDFDVKEMFGSS